MRKIAIYILDAVGPDGMRSLGMKNLESLYRQNGDILTVSGIPHTAPSNSLLWSGVEARKFWVKYTNPAAITSRVDPATFFDRDDADVTTDNVRLWKREDYNHPFIWDYLDADDRPATAYHVPVVLPPYNYGCNPDETDNWFPDTMERCEAHVREFVENSLKYVDESPDLYVTSCQVPDKWWHGMAEWRGGVHEKAEKFVSKEAAWLDNQIPRLVSATVENDMDWVIIGDHGPPKPGSLPINDTDGNPYVLPRHQKHSLIVSNIPEVPTYTKDFYPWLCKELEVDTSLDPDYPGKGSEPDIGRDEETDKDVEAEALKRLKRLGYM